MDLASYKTIAFDLDGTLVDGVASTAIANYIRENGHQSFVIVTFRTLRQTSTLDQELHAYGLSQDMFKSVATCPVKLDLEFHEAQAFRRSARLPDMRSAKELLPAEQKYLEWKGRACSLLGAGLLVDDLPGLVLPGCRKYGIDFMDARAFPIDRAEAA